MLPMGSQRPLMRQLRLLQRLLQRPDYLAWREASLVQPMAEVVHSAQMMSDRGLLHYEAIPPCEQTCGNHSCYCYCKLR
jgi:hypothetical protein